MVIIFLKYAKPHYAAFGSFSHEMTLKTTCVAITLSESFQHHP